jgi:hypothetical protein
MDRVGKTISEAWAERVAREIREEAESVCQGERNEISHPFLVRP